MKSQTPIFVQPAKQACSCATQVAFVSRRAAKARSADCGANHHAKAAIL